MSHRFKFAPTVAVIALLAVVVPAQGGTEAAPRIQILSVSATTMTATLHPIKTNVILVTPRQRFHVMLRNATRLERRSVRVTIAVPEAVPPQRSGVLNVFLPRSTVRVPMRGFSAVPYAQKLKLRVTASGATARTYSVIFIRPAQ